MIKSRDILEKIKIARYNWKDSQINYFLKLKKNFFITVFLITLIFVYMFNGNYDLGNPYDVTKMKLKNPLKNIAKTFNQNSLDKASPNFVSKPLNNLISKSSANGYYSSSLESITFGDKVEVTVIRAD